MPAAGESDASARFCATSGWRSRWPCPSSSTTPHEDRERTGPGERYELNHTAESQKHLSTRAVSGHPVWVCRGGAGAALLGSHGGDLPLRADSCCSCAAAGGTRDGHLADPGSPDRRAGYCSAKISCSPCPSRSLVPEPQSADQLAEVPTVLSPLRIAEQIVGIPVLEGRVQGFLPVQSSTATSSSLERISERIVEQIVDIPSSGGGLGQGSASSAGAADGDVTDFSHFSPFFFSKVRSWLRTRVRGCPLVAAHPLGLLSWRSRPCWTPSSGCSSGNAMLARLTSGTDVLTVQSGRLQLVSRSCGSAKGMRRERSGTGTGIRVSVRITSLLFLLGEGRHRQPLAVYKYWAPCRLCCVEVFFTVNNGHWFCHPRGTLLVLEAITSV